jgi:sulfite reductase alpha subunit-like flavoprotein
LANSFADEMKSRGMKVKCMSMDDYDVEELSEQTEMVYILAATCGEGALPANM